MERLHGKKDRDRDRDRERESSLNTSSQLSNINGGGSTGKKWSFGRLFRRKKEIETESSSEEDGKAGFSTSQKYRLSTGSKQSKIKSTKNNRSNKLTGAGFDHITVNPGGQKHLHHLHHLNQQQQQQQKHQDQKNRDYNPDNVDTEFFLPVETISPQEFYYQNQQQQASAQLYSRSSNFLDQRPVRPALPKMSRSAQRLQNGSGATGAKSSSEEELISLHSSTFSKYRSDESIHSGGQAISGNAGLSRRSRASRNERYYKRLSRDNEVSHGRVPIMYAPQPNQRWKTQPVPLSIYNDPPNPPKPQYGTPTTGQRLQQAGSWQNITPYVQWCQKQQQHQQQLQPSKNLQNSVNESKRSISYDNHIHLQNINGHQQQTKAMPPPPPPRDPLRRVQMTGESNSHVQLHNYSSSDLRPLSYAFDPNGMTVLQASGGLSNRCVSDDKIWASQQPIHYQSVHSLNMPSNANSKHSQTQTHRAAGLSRRFITRAERDAQHPSKKSLPNGLDFHYVADAAPRSRKPIHMIRSPQNDDPTPPSSGTVRTTKSGLPTTSTSKSVGAYLWKSMDEQSNCRGRDFLRTPCDGALKPRSISSDTLSHTVPVYSEALKPSIRYLKASVASPNAILLSDDAQNVVCGSLHIKPGYDSTKNIVEIRRHKDFNKSNSMPNTYNQKRSSSELAIAPNKYDEYVAEKRQQYHKPIFNSPIPPQRKQTIPVEELPLSISRKKPANLEEAINELEAIYKSLGLPDQPDKKECVPVPVTVPVEFDKYALAHADEYDDQDSPSGEPDPVRDDVAYRNIQLANLYHKSNEKQPPFGIPIGPIAPSPQTDYLHITPTNEKINSKATSRAPDIVKDDLAVRLLRKDPPGPKEKFISPNSKLQKKNRATRTQSANIYSLIQRDAAKPSGGDLNSYMELARSIERAGSMSNLNDDVLTADAVPSTLTLLCRIRAQEEQPQVGPLKPTSHNPFKHSSRCGAICQLPDKLFNVSTEEIHKAPVPLPRKSLTPEPATASHQMEDALNKIAKDAQESSAKLSKELQELRKEALITASGAKGSNPEEERLEKDLREIEAVSEAAKRCGQMLLDTLPDVNKDDTTDTTKKPRKLYKERKLIKAIDQVSEAANAVCEKILKDIVTTEPPVIVQEAVKVKNKPKQHEPLVMPNLIKKLDPMQSDKIEAIAKRCMRQLSDLAESPDYDNIANQNVSPVLAKENTNIAPACNKSHSEKILDVQMSSLAENASKLAPKPGIEEIDVIMLECEAQAHTQKQYEEQNQKQNQTTTKENFQLTPRNNIENDDKNEKIKSTVPSTNLMTSSSSSCNAPNSGAFTTTAPNTASSNPTSSFSSSSDCLAKSSSPSASRRQSSSITSFNPYSSSDYIKSPSSEYHAPSTDPIKTFSTTSYDVKSTSATPNVTTNSTFSYSPSPSPLLNLMSVSEHKCSTAAATANANATAVAAVNANVSGTVTATATATATDRSSVDRARSSSPSQYNSSEELAMIFGIAEKPRNSRGSSEKQQQIQEQRHDTKHERKQQSPTTPTTATATETETTTQNSVSDEQTF